METDGLVSKPLALVLIGLIIGASLGLGSGYAVFYSEMVERSNRDLEGPDNGPRGWRRRNNGTDGRHG